MSTENTPLLGGPPPRLHRRKSLSGLRVFKRLACISISSVLLLTALSISSFAAILLWPHGEKNKSIWHNIHSSVTDKFISKISHEEVRRILTETPSGQKSEEWSRYYTAGPHLAGKNLSQAIWTRDKWQQWGIKSSITPYDVYINYPVDHGLSLLSSNTTTTTTTPTKLSSPTWEALYRASLEEDILPSDPSSSLPNRIPTFHGYSASGNVTGQFVYVNYGTWRDYDDLIKAGIDLKGKIALARYGGILRGLKVKRAEELGMVGVVLFTDPGEDGEKTKENGYEEYPNGPARHPSSVQRGSTQYLSVRPGDPTTPGYPSKPGVPRESLEGAIPSIPSLPISYRDALPILKALNGHGPAASDINPAWSRDIGLSYLGINYNVGPSPENLVLNLFNKQKYVTTPLWNVIGVINGTLADEVIVLGNHRDAWIAGGAADPNSGSAVLNEVIRSVGAALEAGWKPLRTIVFASWDGEEYGLVGSTEWVEEYLPWLSAASVAYVNVDVGVGGPHFDASAAPLLHPLLRKAVGDVLSPNQTVEGQTIGDLWKGSIRTMGSGSDFTAFQDFAGIASLDMGFKAQDGSAAYHYHSNYDSFYWMENFGDPGFYYHRAMAQLTGLVLADLVNLPVTPFSATTYADELSRYLDAVDSKLAAATAVSEAHVAKAENATMEILGMTHDDLHFAQRARPEAVSKKTSPDSFKKHLATLRKTLKKFRGAAVKLDEEREWVTGELEKGFSWWRFWHVPRVIAALVRTNYKYKVLERAFLYQGGLDGRDWFKHVVFAPGLWTGYAGAVFPGLMESIDTEDYANAVKWAEIIDGCFEKAVGAAEIKDLPEYDYEVVKSLVVGAI